MEITDKIFVLYSATGTVITEEQRKEDMQSGENQ